MNNLQANNLSVYQQQELMKKMEQMQMKDSLTYVTFRGISDLATN